MYPYSQITTVYTQICGTNNVNCGIIQMIQKEIDISTISNREDKFSFSRQVNIVRKFLMLKITNLSFIVNFNNVSSLFVVFFLFPMQLSIMSIHYLVQQPHLRSNPTSATSPLRLYTHFNICCHCQFPLQQLSIRSSHSPAIPTSATFSSFLNSKMQCS